MHIHTAENLLDMGFFFSSQNDFDKAESHFLQSLRIAEALYDTSALDLLRFLEAISHFYSEYDQMQLALTCQKRITNILENAPGTNELDLVQGLTSMALQSLLDHQSNNADSLYQRALAILKANFGSNHPELVRVMMDLASLYWEMGNDEKAKLYYNRSISISGKTAVAQSLINYAWVQAELGRIQNAESAYLRALAIQEKAYGKTSAKLIIVLEDIQRFYTETNNLKQAAVYQQRITALEVN